MSEAVHYLPIHCCTWNILAQRFSPDDDFMEWPERLELILKSIIQTDSDIICLQEVELETANEDFSRLFDKYDFSVHKKSKKRTSFIGNMTLWKKSMFALEVDKFNSTGVHVLLVHIESLKKLLLSNIHLKAGVSTQEGERINQINSTFKILSKLREENKPNVIPSIVLGDFNDDLKEHRKLRPLIEENGYICKSPPYPTCYVAHGWKDKYWRFDHVITFPNITIEYEDVPKMRVIPDKDNMSDHFLVKFMVKI